MDNALSAGAGDLPAELVLVRHAESVGNLAAESAGRQGLARLDLPFRDPDTPLSDNGLDQAQALGRHLARAPADTRPEVVLGSPYVRARTTLERALDWPEAPRPVLDERLRERDLGLFDGFTGSGIRDTYPEEAQRRAAMGKFYYRPPGGESWTDVVLRVRSVLGEVLGAHAGRRVWVFTHQAVIMAFRYLLEGLDEKELLRIDGDTPLANCSMTRYRPEGGGMVLVEYGDVAHLEDSPAQPTHEEPHTPQEPVDEGVAHG